MEVTELEQIVMTQHAAATTACRLIGSNSQICPNLSLLAVTVVKLFIKLFVVGPIK